MGKQPVYFQGQELPPTREGHVYGIRLYPGGRKELRQYKPDDLMYVSQAVKALMANKCVDVWLDDAAQVWLEYSLQIPCEKGYSHQ